MSYGNTVHDVIVINYIGRKGGGALDAYEMAEALVNRGEKVIPIIPSTIENRMLWDKLQSYKIIYLETYDGVISLIFKTLFFGKLKKEIEGKIQGIKVGMVYSPMVGFWTKKINDIFCDSKKIIVCHDPFPHSGKGRIYYYLFNHMFDSADIVVVHTKKFVRYLKCKYRDVRYIPLGPHNMYRKAENKVSIIEYDPNSINFLFFGRIDKYKGVDILLSAYQKIEKKYKEKVSLTIVGQGDCSEYMSIIKTINNVKIINRWIKDKEVESIFSGKNIITVCPYKDATQSGVVMVSYDYGNPVIATRTGGLDEQVIDGYTGYLIEKKNVKKLYYAMKRFVVSPNTIQDMKENIKDYLFNISWDKSAEMLVDIAFSE